MSNKFWSKYYGSLVGAEILSFDGMTESDFGDGFPSFTVKFGGGEVMETATKQEILDKTNAILQEYKNLVMRLWDLYEEMDQEDTDLVNEVGADKWFKYAFTLSLDELWHEAGSWELTREDLKMEGNSNE